MAEQTFKSPGFFEREIDLSQRETEIVGVPAGVAGTAEMGPAFVPVTVGSFSDFERRFGTLDPSKFGPYAVREFLKHKTALTYVRVLGAGANLTTTDFTTTATQGTVKSAGFKLIGATPSYRVEGVQNSRQVGAVQFIAAQHYVSAAADTGYPIFTDNDSYGISGGDDHVYLVRAMLFTTTGSQFQIMCHNSASYSPLFSAQNDLATVSTSGEFKLILSSAAGAGFAQTDGAPGIRIYTASLDPTSKTYVGKVLNTDPEMFQVEQHLLYADFPVSSEIASVSYKARPTVALVSGSARASARSGDTSLTFNNGYGRFDTRYDTPRTTNFISQPYGTKEWELFRFETISDGAVANEKFKISISKIAKSANPSSPYGTFTVQVRSFDDSDTGPKVLERYPQCTLNPNDDDFIAKKIGDFKAFYAFDAEQESERKVLVSGKYPNQSSRIRVVMSNDFNSGEVPDDAVPFGFRGYPCLKTNDTLTDQNRGAISSTHGLATSRRLTMTISTASSGLGNQAIWMTPLSGSILPPVPLRFKVTKGQLETSPGFAGDNGIEELVDGRLYWGAKFDRIPRTGSLSNAIYQSNASSEINDIFRSYSKFIGIQKLDMLVTGSDADVFNDNKFTLARVALPNELKNNDSGTPDLSVTANTYLTGTAKDHMLATAYIRNGKPAPGTYTVSDGNMQKRLTFGSLMALTSSTFFNRFTDYAKFTNFFFGGFDGVNILDTDMSRMNDRATSSDTGGKAAISNPASDSDLDIGISSENDFGVGKNNTTINAYRTAARILTDPFASRVNIIVVPGIRDPYLTDYLLELLPDYGQAFYSMDLPSYDAEGARLFINSKNAPNVTKTAEKFGSRAVDNNFGATYFPDVTIDDPINNRPVPVPASVAVMGALAYNDTVAYPWFAPAGFNRAALGFVTNTKVRLNQGDRDTLYTERINPIATFPQAGYVIFGQKTMQLSRSALDRVNVRRMLLEIKRLVTQVANSIIFEANTPSTRARFVAQVTPLLSTVQIQQGVDQFKVVMDSSNNTQEDIESNILNGRIVVVPTRAVEFISIDFIITNAGVSFE
jgi:hypothetical protein